MLEIERDIPHFEAFEKLEEKAEGKLSLQDFESGGKFGKEEKKYTI